MNVKRFPKRVTVEVVGPGEMLASDEKALMMLVSGRGSLSSILGDEAARQRLFMNRIDWQRVFVARIKNRTVGFLAFQWQGKGPYRITLRDFCDEFGAWSGLWRGLAHYFLEWRTRSYGLYVYGLKVLPAARRRGVARALILAAEAHARALGAQTLELEVLEENARAVAFYSALGFQTVRTRDLGWFSRFFGVSRVRHLAQRLATETPSS